MSKHQNLLFHRSVGRLFLLPSFLLLVGVRLYPLLNGMFLSLTDANLLRLKKIRFIGIPNFIEVFTEDPLFYKVLLFTLIYTFAVVFFSYLVGFILALLLNTDIRFRGVFRVLVLVPWVIPPAVGTINWKLLLNDQFGFINKLLLHIGFIEEPIGFFSSILMARGTVIAFSVWKSMPFMMIVLLAGLQAIPHDYYEAAVIDGAGWFRRTWIITIPLLRNVTIVSTLLMTMWTFNNFENIYLMTGGGPDNGTNSFSVFSYIVAFFRFRIGYASAVSIVMMFILIGVSILSLRNNKSIY